MKDITPSNNDQIVIKERKNKLTIVLLFDVRTIGKTVLINRCVHGWLVVI